MDYSPESREERGIRKKSGDGLNILRLRESGRAGGRYESDGQSEGQEWKRPHRGQPENHLSRRTGDGSRVDFRVLISGEGLQFLKA